MDQINQLREYSAKLENLIGRLDRPKHRIIHLNDNPTDRALKRRRSKTENIKRDNERLKARLAILEAGNSADVTRRIDDAVNSTKQIELLTRKVHELKSREDRILNSFKKTSREFREVCYMLTGFLIDPLKDEVFRLSHMYAENEDDRLFFEVKRDGTISLLKNEYTDQFSHHISTYLEEADSFPAFLAAITLDLYKQSTLVNIGDPMDMSITMAPNSTMRPTNMTSSLWASHPRK